MSRRRPKRLAEPHIEFFYPATGYDLGDLSPVERLARDIVKSLSPPRAAECLAAVQKHVGVKCAAFDGVDPALGNLH